VSYPELYPSGPGTPAAVSAAELEAAVFHVGRAVWREASTLGVRTEVMEELDGALEAYHAILRGPGRSPERRAEALSRAAGDILRWTAELIRQAPAAAERAA
jgi:hypothetical protein